jgi:chromosomal replication initiator protein
MSQVYAPRSQALDELIGLAAQLFRVDRAELLSACRRREVAWARQALAYALYRSTDLSYERIGQLLAGREHSTIIYAVKVAEQRAVTNYEFALNLSALLFAQR